MFGNKVSQSVLWHCQSHRCCKLLSCRSTKSFITSCRSGKKQWKKELLRMIKLILWGGKSLISLSKPLKPLIYWIFIRLIAHQRDEVGGWKWRENIAWFIFPIKAGIKEYSFECAASKFLSLWNAINHSCCEGEKTRREKNFWLDVLAISIPTSNLPSLC